MPPAAGTKVKLDRQRTLRYRMRAWEAFQTATGRNVMEEGALQNLELSDMVSLIWAGLLHEDPDLTRDQVADMIGIRELTEIQPVLARALNGDLAEPSPKEGEKKGARKNRSP